MKRSTFLLHLTIFLFTTLAHGQHRVDRPLQVQLNLSGGFLDIAGNALTDPTVDELKVNKWKM